MDKLKTLLAEAADNLLVAGSLMFLLIAFLFAIAEPMASLLPLGLSVLLYGLARLTD